MMRGQHEACSCDVGSAGNASHVVALRRQHSLVSRKAQCAPGDVETYDREMLFDDTDGRNSIELLRD